MTTQISSDPKITLFKRDYVLSAQSIVWVIMIVAVLLRLLSAIYQGNAVTDLPGIYDQISYDGLARRVIEGHGFSFAEDHWPVTRGGEPTAHWSYLYTVYLVAVYKIFGVYPIIARIIQAIVTGIFQTWFTWLIGRRLFGQTVGLIASAVSAVYIYFFYYAGGLVTEPFYIVSILWTFDAAFRIVHRSRDNQRYPLWQDWFELGLAIGLTVLFRQLFLLFIPFLFLWVWWNFEERQSKEPKAGYLGKHNFHVPALKGLLLVGLVIVLMILPWTIRNYQVFDTFVLLNTNAGFAFYWSNHPIHGTHFMPLLSVPGQSYQSLIPPDLLVLNEGKLDKALLQEGIRIVLSDPVRYALLSFSRIEEYIRFWPSKDSSLLSNISRVGSFGILLPFMLFGLWSSSLRLRNPSYQGQRSELFLIYLFFVVYTLIHLLSWTLIRYRLPIDGFLVIFAALSFETLSRKFIPVSWK